MPNQQMAPYKKKVASSVAATWTGLESAYAKGMVRIQAIYYGNTEPTESLKLRDADDDEFIDPIAGAATPTIQRLASPVTVRLPIDYYDSDAGGANEIRIWGEFLP